MEIIPRLSFWPYIELEMAWHAFEPQPILDVFHRHGIELEHYEPIDDDWLHICHTMYSWLKRGYVSVEAPRQEMETYLDWWQRFFEKDLAHFLNSYITPHPGFVYILKADEFYKIGRTKDVTKRFPQIHVHLPFETRLWALYYSPDHLTGEQILHTFFQNIRLNGEWFKLSPNTAMNLRLSQPAFFIREGTKQAGNQTNWIESVTHHDQNLQRPQWIPKGLDSHEH